MYVRSNSQSAASGSAGGWLARSSRDRTAADTDASFDSLVANYTYGLMGDLRSQPTLFREQEVALVNYFGSDVPADDSGRVSGATIGIRATADVIATGGILDAADRIAADDDSVDGDVGAGTVSINTVTVTEGAAGSGTMATFTVTRAGGVSAFSVNYATASGTAVQGGDFQATSGTLSFAAGEDSRTVTVMVNGDATDEASEAFFVGLSGATAGASVSGSRGQGTIVDDDIGDDITCSSNGSSTVADGMNAASERDWFRATLQSGIAMSFNERGHPSGGGSLAGAAARLDKSGGAKGAFIDDGSFGFESLSIDSPTTSSSSYALAAAVGGNDASDALISGDTQFFSAPADMMVLEQLITTWFGQDGDDRIVGSAAADIIDGGLGNDTLIGGAGADTYFVDSSFDVIVETAGRDTDTVYATSTYALADNVENIYLQGTADLAAYGNASSNLMFGNSGDNVIDGGAAADVLYGLDGRDIFVLRLGDGNGDVIMDFAGQGDAFGDSLQFFGLGTADTSVTQINATLWRAAGSQGSLQFSLANGAALYASDYTFHV